MIAIRRAQLSFADCFITEQVDDLWEPWLKQADLALDDEQLLEIVQTAFSKLCRKSKTRGRAGTPAEIILRLLLLKHIRDWSFEELEREVRTNLVYREFTKIGGGKVPDNKSISRFARQLGPEVVEQLHQRIVGIAFEKGVVQGRKLRVDTTVVETDIHYPTDSTLLGDGVRVLTRIMQKVTKVAGEAGTRLRDRTRIVKRRLLEIVRASRNKTEQGQTKLKTAYRRLLNSVVRVVGQAKKFSAEITSKVKRGKRSVLRKAKQQLEQMIPRIRHVMRQTRHRIFAGNTRSEDKIVSLFEPQTEIIRKGKASKPTEFGKLVKIQEAENQIITHYSVFDQRPSDSEVLIPALEQHQLQFGAAPKLVAADAGFFSAANEAKAKQLGVRQVAIPNSSTKSPQRKKRQKRPWFKDAMRWRSGSEGRISVLKRRHGLTRSRYKGSEGIKRWVGFGVIADTAINISNFMAASAKN